MWKRFSISYSGGRIRKHFWNLFNLSVEEICNILQGLKSYWNVERKEEHGTFFQLYRNLPQTKMWQRFAISYRVEELLKCGRKRKNWIFANVQQSSTNWNVEENFISVKFWNLFNSSMEEICNILQGCLIS